MSPGGAAGGNLADLVVQFVVKGQEDLKKSLDWLNAQIAALRAVASQMLEKMSEGIKQTTEKTKEAGEQTSKLGESFKKVGDIINIALGAGVGIIANFVRQGMAAGAMGQLFGYTMERLSLTISGLFRPEIQKVLDLINRLTTWLQNLTDAQRQQIAYWAQGAAAALAVGLVLPRIVAGIQAIIVATKALGAAIAGSLSLTGIGAILPLIGLIAQAITALLVGTKEGRDALSELWDVLKEVGKSARQLWEALRLGPIFAAIWDGVTFTVQVFGKLIEKIAELIQKLREARPMWLGFVSDMVDGAVILAHAFRASLSDVRRNLGMRPPGGGEGNRGPDAHRIGGFEDLNATYQRIAIASMRASAGLRSPEERTAQNTEQALNELRQIRTNTGNPQPMFAR